MCKIAIYPKKELDKWLFIERTKRYAYFYISGLPYIEEFKDTDCQILITSGYDEYEEELQSEFLIDYLSTENKLLKRKRKLKKG